MTIKQQGGIFGRNPSFNDVDINTASVSGSLTANLIGIGTSPTSGALQIASGLSSTAFLENTSSAYCFVGLKDTTGNLSYFGSANGEFKIQTAGSGYADKLKVSSVGDVTVNLGNLVIGTSGKGIDFSATAGTGTSELLSDYEEGTFTPTVFGATAAGTTVYNSQSGHYTKIGNTVTAHISIGVTSATGTGAIRIGGLPFVQNANVSGTFPVATNNVNWTGGTYLAGIFSETTTNLRIFGIVDNGGWVEQNIANATVIWRISVVYQV